MIKRLALIIIILGAQSLIFYQISGIIWQDKIYELESRLSNISFEQNSDSLVNIAGRLKLIQNRLNSDEISIENYEYEARIQSLSSGSSLYGKQEHIDTGTESLIVRISRFLLRKKVPEKVDDPSYFSTLEEAYFWERNRHYVNAVEKYTMLLENYSEELTESMLNTIMLHMSFSNLMQAEYEQAGKEANTVIVQSDNLAYRATGRKILDFINSMNHRKAKLAQLESDSLELGRELFLSVRYNEAVEVLTNFLDSPISPVEEAEARYFMGRALEETGQVGKSIFEYQRVLLLSEDENLFLDSNRRMVMLNTFYDVTENENEKLKLSLQDFTDPELESILEPFEKLYSEPAVIPEEHSDSQEKTGETSTIDTDDNDKGEIYVSTLPSGARISINDIFFGISPLFVSSLPSGLISIKAQYEDMNGEAEIEVSTRIIRRIDIELNKSVSEKTLETQEITEITEIPRGKLRISHDLTNIVLMIDYEEIMYDPEDLPELPVGQYILMAEGKDQSGQLLFWEGVIQITKDSVTEVSIP